MITVHTLLRPNFGVWTLNTYVDSGGHKALARRVWPIYVSAFSLTSPQRRARCLAARLDNLILLLQLGVCYYT